MRDAVIGRIRLLRRRGPRVPPVAVAVMLGAACGLSACAEPLPAATPPAGYGTICYAGAYTCQLSAPEPVSTQCSCPGIGARSFGAVR